MAWPFEWYLRDYTTAATTRRRSIRDINLADYPVILRDGRRTWIRSRISSPTTTAQKYKLNSWFPEDYKQNTLSSMAKALMDPETRAKLVKYLVYRELLSPTGAREFYFYVRDDIPAVGPAPLDRAGPSQDQTTAAVPAGPAKAAARAARRCHDLRAWH